MKALTATRVSRRKDVRLILFVLLALLVLGLTACGGDPSPASSGSQSVTPTTAVEATSAAVDTLTVAPPKPTTAPPPPTPTEVKNAGPSETIEPAPTPSSPQEIGTQTAGTSIVIAGHKIRLLDDVWVVSWKTELACAEGQKCPATPYWTLQSEDSTIEIDANGKIWSELTGCGNPAVFDFVKEALR